VHNPSVEAVAVNPHDAQMVVVALESGGIEKSKDGGRHWQFAPVRREAAGLSGPQLTSIAFDNDVPPEVWVGSRHEGVFSLRAAAQMWVSRGLRGLWISQVLPTRRSDGALVVTAVHQAFRTVNTGASRWTRSFGGRAFGFVGDQSRDATYVWTGNRVYRSQDDGVTWLPLAPLPHG
jgi:hypothetical protein